MKQVGSMINHRGFTLIELMVVVVVIAVLAAIAIPSYQSYIRKKDLALAQQEASKLASELERFKNKNFSYKGFDPSYLYGSTEVENLDGDKTTKSFYDAQTGSLTLPIGTTQGDAKYTLTILDADSMANKKRLLSASDSKGLNWVIYVERARESDLPKEPNNYDLLLTSTGIRCMTKIKDVIKGSDYKSCESGSEAW